MKKLSKLILLLVWLALLGGSGLWYALFAPRQAEYDPRENRNFHAAPELSLGAVWNGELSESTESWLLDRFWARDAALDAARSLRDWLSIANYKDSLVVLGGKDPLSGEAPEQTTLEEMAGSLLKPSPSPYPSPSPTPTSEPTPPPEPTPTPKPSADPEDFPLYPKVFSPENGSARNWLNYSRTNALAMASVLGRIAALLPETGRLVYTMVPQSSIGNSYRLSHSHEGFESQTEPIVHAFTPDNVTAIDSAKILGEAIVREEYVYFRTDMHWTPQGTYLVYRQMAEAAGKEPAAWEDFDIQVEEPFRGTYYRDNPEVYKYSVPDSLSLLSPRFPLEWRRVTAPGEYELIPFLDFNAAKNDRYTVYLGGPAGPWTYTDADNGREENCLVICDSFGIAFVPMVAMNYKQVHYYDPRYFDASAVGGSLKELIEEFQIEDVYVVIGDLHSYNSDFILKQVSEQLGDQ